MAPRKSKAAAAPPENPLSAGPQPTFGDVAEPIRTVDEANAVRVAEAKGDMLYLRHSQIIADPHNPRTDFDDEALAELADSIATHGLMQNLVVMAEHDWTGTRHQLIAGERRWRAIGKLFDDGRWDADALIPCKAMAGLDDEARAIQALMENLVRRDLKPLEEARAFKALRDTYGQKTDDIAGKVNRTQRFVQQRLQLLELDDADQKRLDAGQITVEDARKRVAAKPRAAELEPGAALMLAEMLHKMANDKLGDGRIQVGNAAHDDAILAGLKSLFYIHGPSPIMEEGVRTGHFYCYLSGYYINQPTREALPTVADGPYQTAWLNGPFAVSAEVEAEIAEAKEALELSRAERRANEQRYAQALAERRADVARLRQCAPDPATALGRLLAEQIDTFALPLPWSIQRGEHWSYLVAANGRRVVNDSYSSSGAIDLAELICIAVNNAAGVATPEAYVAPESEQEPDQDIDGFDPDAEDGDELEDEAAAELEDA